jgi:hypothetical protein
MDDLRRERDRLKNRRGYSHRHNPNVQRRLDYIAQCLHDLKRERRRIKKYGVDRHSTRRY